MTTQRAFTLIELLIVIAIIAILAALIVPLTGVAMAKQKIERTKTERAQLETVIEQYKSKRGHYPPDNPTNAAAPPLFYELTGTVYDKREANSMPVHYYRVNGGENIAGNQLRSVFGVDGFVNSSFVSNRTDNALLQGVEARDYFPNINPKQHFEFQSGNVKFQRLGAPIDGPQELRSTAGTIFTPWHYNASNPTNNPSTYDLWIDLVIRGKTNRICNWQDSPIIIQ